MPYADQTLDLEDSIVATEAILAVYASGNEEDFAAAVKDLFPEGSTTGFSPRTVFVPAVGAVLTPDGELWGLGEGVQDLGRFFASFVISEPVYTNDDRYLVHPIAAAQQERLHRLVKPVLQTGFVTKLRLCGHSMGGAAATIEAGELSSQGLLPSDTKVITAGAPKPGDSALRRDLVGIHVVRWINEYDPVPLIPPVTGLVGSMVFNFPGTIAVGKLVGYMQVHGGRLIDPNNGTWDFAEQDIGFFNLLAMTIWLCQGDFQWLTYHSLRTYQQKFLNLDDAYGNRGDVTAIPTFAGEPIAEVGTITVPQALLPDTTPNKRAAMTPGPMMLVSIKGQMGGQGWSCNFFTNTLDYDTAVKKGQAVANAMVAAMHQDASLFAVVASKTDVQGDSRDVYNTQAGALNPSVVGSAQPNVAARIQFTTNGKQRRIFWIHGLTAEMYKLPASNTWWPTGSSLSGINNFIAALYNPVTKAGLITSGTGMYDRITNPGVKPYLGNIQTITADLAGNAVLTLDRNHGIANNTGVQVQVRGRVFLGTLRGVSAIAPIAAPNAVTLLKPFPAGFTYQQGALLSLVGFQFDQPDNLVFEGLATHRTGAPYGRLRGRRSNRM